MHDVCHNGVTISSLEILCRPFLQPCCSLFVVLSVISSVFTNSKVCSVRLSSGDCLVPWRIFHFYALKNSFYCLLWIVIHLHCEALSDRFCRVQLNLRREHSPVHFTVHRAASISSHIIVKHRWHSSTGSHTCLCHNTASTVLDRWCDMLLIISCFTCSPFFSLPITFISFFLLLLLTFRSSWV